MMPSVGAAATRTEAAISLGPPSPLTPLKGSSQKIRKHYSSTIGVRLQELQTGTYLTSQ